MLFSYCKGKCKASVHFYRKSLAGGHTPEWLNIICVWYIYEHSVVYIPNVWWSTRYVERPMNSKHLGWSFIKKYTTPVNQDEVHASLHRELTCPRLGSPLIWPLCMLSEWMGEAHYLGKSSSCHSSFSSTPSILSRASVVATDSWRSRLPRQREREGRLSISTYRTRGQRSTSWPCYGSFLSHMQRKKI